MDEATLSREIDRAFAGVYRPSAFTECPCEDCARLDALLQSRDHATLKAKDMGTSECLLTEAGRRYWAPSLMKLCMAAEFSGDLELSLDSFLRELWQPFSRSDFPREHPRFGSLTAQQTQAILEFLRFVERKWHTKRGKSTPRELARAVANWTRFADIASGSDRPTHSERSADDS